MYCWVISVDRLIFWWNKVSHSNNNNNPNALSLRPYVVYTRESNYCKLCVIMSYRCCYTVGSIGMFPDVLLTNFATRFVNQKGAKSKDIKRCAPLNRVKTLWRAIKPSAHLQQKFIPSRSWFDLAEQ